MMRLRLIPVFLAGAILCSTPAMAQRSAKVTQGTTSSDLASMVNELRTSNAELGARLSGVEADRAQLNGQVETLEFLLSQSRDQINEMQADDAEIGRLLERLEQKIDRQEGEIAELRSRLDDADAQVTARNAETMFGPLSGEDAKKAGATGSDSGGLAVIEPEAAPSGPTRIVRAADPADDLGGDIVTTASQLPQGSLGTLPASALPGEAGPLFASAKSRLLQFDYSGAETAFRAFLEQFGDDPQAGEAQYWLAETLYQQSAYGESGQAYTTMIRQYPDDPRAPEALAKLARTMRLVGDTEKACNALDILPQRYPDASGVTRNLAAGERVRSGCDS